MDAATELLRVLDLAHRRLDRRDRGLSPTLPGDEAEGPARPRTAPSPSRRASRGRAVIHRGHLSLIRPS